MRFDSARFTTQDSLISRTPHGWCGVENYALKTADIALRELMNALQSEICNEDEASTPSGMELIGEERGRDLGYRAGWNARSRSLLARMEVRRV